MPEASDTNKSSTFDVRASAPPASWQKTLQRFVASVRRAYGARLHRLVLFGSHARGDAVSDSDVDVLVVLHECPDFWAEHRRLGDIASEVSIGSETLVSARLIGRKDFEHRRTPLLLNIRREGVDIT